MTSKPLDRLLQNLRRVAAVQHSRRLSDRVLLDHFIEVHDEAAFRVLVERHGPMVLGVCRRALGNLHDAEDACQATFLVLAQKASSIRKKASLSSWLHGVACRVALNLQRDRSRRRRHEEKGASDSTYVGADLGGLEILAALDEELQRLPERYRTPLILCYLESKTRGEAARLLGLTEGSLHGRLERGRTLLRDRLTRRGLALSALLGTTLGEGVASAALSPTLVSSATKAALLLAAGQPLTGGVVSASILSLTQKVVKAMFLTKLKIGAAMVLGVAVMATVVGGSLSTIGIAQVADPGAAKAAASAFAAESDEEFIRRMSKDLRGTDPTPTEVHFFLATKDAGKRQKLIDLFIQERQPKREQELQDLKDAQLLKEIQDRGYPLFAHENIEDLLKRVMKQRRTLLIELGTKQSNFEFRDKPWADVLTWLAGQSRLPVINGDGGTKLQGTFSHLNPQGEKYSILEIVDLLNKALATQPTKYRLLLRDRNFLLVPLDAGNLPKQPEGSTILWYPCKYIKAREAATMLREQLNDPAATIQLFTITYEETTNMVLVSGPADQIGKAMHILKIIDLVTADQSPRGGIR